ncbi:MAG: hypothetical protein AB7P40_08460, partial [Chloroflexota bacterium]
MRRIIRPISAVLVSTLVVVSSIVVTYRDTLADGRLHEALPTVQSVRSQSSDFVEAFDAQPESPEAWHPANWDVQVHHVDEPDWKVFPPIAAQHSASCGAPPATHMVTTHEQA